MSMYRQQNPLGIFEIATSAALVALGLGGLVMGRLEVLRQNMDNGLAPEPEVEPVVPDVDEELAEQRAWMNEHYPGGKCFRKGWARGWSVTGVDDGMSLEFEIYERPDDLTWKWFSIWALKHPQGVSFGAEPFSDAGEATRAVMDRQQQGFDAYYSRKEYRGDPYVSKPPASGFYAC